MKILHVPVTSQVNKPWRLTYFLKQSCTYYVGLVFQLVSYV